MTALNRVNVFFTVHICTEMHTNPSSVCLSHSDNSKRKGQTP